MGGDAGLSPAVTGVGVTGTTMGHGVMNVSDVPALDFYFALH